MLTFVCVARETDSKASFIFFFSCIELSRVQSTKSKDRVAGIAESDLFDLSLNPLPFFPSSRSPIAFDVCQAD